MGEAVFEGIINLVTRRQNTVAQYIATQPIMDLCEQATRQLGARVSRRWWEQAGIDLEGATKRAEEAATFLESESELESELESDSESDLESSANPGGEEDSRGASGSSGAERSGAEE